MFSHSISILGIGFSLGLLHAFDADHVMAVSTLSAEKPGLLRTLRFSANWALGHSGVLLVSGLLLFGLGVSIPSELQHLAEMSVGVLLIGLGLWCFWRFHRQRIQINVHRHGDVVHTHWHQQSHIQNAIKSDDSSKTMANHTPVMVGVLHGLAGSAPALALVPAVAQGEMIMAMLYLVLFSAGVMLSMVLFGSMLGTLQQRLQRSNRILLSISRYGIATGSILLGSLWLYQAV